MRSFLTEAQRDAVTQTVMDESANIILACAITALFLVKNKGAKVDTSHVDTMLGYAARAPEHNFGSSETASDTYDQIAMRIPMSPEAKSYIFSDQFDTTLVDNLIKFVNDNSKFNELVSSVTNNGLINRIVIDVENVSANDSAITTIMVDNEMVKFDGYVLPIYDVRAGIGGIGKKELDKDYGYESHRNFIKSAFDLDIGTKSAVYYETCHNNGEPTSSTVETATRALYDEVCRKINQGLSGALDTPLHDFKHNFIATMLSCSYGVRDDSDTFCIIIPSSKVGHTAFNSKDVFESLYTNKLQAKCPSHMNPSIRIMDGENRELFQVRFKKERYGDNLTGHRYKMYFKPSRVKEHF